MMGNAGWWVVIAGIIMLLLGLWWGEMEVVLQAGTRICFECMGLGG